MLGWSLYVGPRGPLRLLHISPATPLVSPSSHKEASISEHLGTRVHQAVLRGFKGERSGRREWPSRARDVGTHFRRSHELFLERVRACRDEGGVPRHGRRAGDAPSRRGGKQAGTLSSPTRTAWHAHAFWEARASAGCGLCAEACRNNPHSYVPCSFPLSPVRAADEAGSIVMLRIVRWRYHGGRTGGRVFAPGELTHPQCVYASFTRLGPLGRTR